MRKYTTYVGMDVHARSIEASAVDLGTGESFSRSFAGCPTAADVAEWLTALPQPVYCAYESGCTGFALARGLRALGFDCDVIAVSTLPLSAKDRKQKCDRLDARAIRREIANPDSRHSVVWVPDEKTEAERDLVRCYRVAVDAAKRAKQRLLMFLMRHGHVWNERTRTGRPKRAWTRDFERWPDSISFAELSAETAFAAYRRQVGDACREAGELRAQVRELASRPEHRPYVDALTCLRGVDVETAVLARVEFGDFSRFRSGRRVSCWLGTVPADGSSGERRGGRRGITKAGDRHLRRALVEGYSGVATWKSGRKAVPRGAEPSTACRSIASRANERLLGRYDHLARERHKGANVPKVAVVSELVRWMWVIGLQVQREQEAPATA
jgi:transposase